jgi:hypothetical protein
VQYDAFVDVPVERASLDAHCCILEVLVELLGNWFDVAFYF